MKTQYAHTSRQRRNGRVDVDMVELTELERRILTIAGGLNFANW